MKSKFIFDVNASLDNAYDLIHVSSLPFLLGENPQKLNQLNAKKVLLSLPFVSKGNAYKVFAEKFTELSKYVDGFTIQNIGDYYYLSELFEKNNIERKNFFLAGDYSLNATNSETALFWAGKLDSIAILPELTIEKQFALAKTFPNGLAPEIINSEEIIVCRSEHCFAVSGNHYNCGACGKFGLSAGNIFNEKKETFKVVTNRLDCNSILIAKNPNREELKLDNKWIIRV